jgi:hypothetical protein
MGARDLVWFALDDSALANNATKPINTMHRRIYPAFLDSEPSPAEKTNEVSEARIWLDVAKMFDKAVKLGFR